MGIDGHVNYLEARQCHELRWLQQCLHGASLDIDIYKAVYRIDP